MTDGDDAGAAVQLSRVFHGDPAKIALPDPELSSELLEFVAHRYGLVTERPVDLGGSFNLNVLVDEHVVRVYGPWVSTERLQELQRVREELRSSGMPTPKVRTDRHRSTWSTFSDSVLEVE